MFVALVTRHAMRMSHIVIYGLSGSKIYFHISHKRYDFRKKVTEHVCFDFICNFVWNISHSKKN